MSQPLLTASLTLIIAVILTHTITVATSGTKTSYSAIKVTVIGAAIALAALALHSANVRINFTDSMPLGIYLLSPLPPYGAKRGTLVAACAPGSAVEVGRERGYLGAGPCPDNTEAVLKSVAAIGGDELNVTSAGVTVNGCLLSLSLPDPRDRSGRPLASWSARHYRLAPRQVWLYAPNGLSWDSRYWGPISSASIEGQAIPLLVFPYAFRVPDRPTTPASLLDVL